MLEWAEVVGKDLLRRRKLTRLRYFVSTDTQEVVNMARRRFGYDAVIATDGPIEVSAPARYRVPGRRLCTTRGVKYSFPRNRYVARHVAGMSHQTANSAMVPDRA